LYMLFAHWLWLSFPTLIIASATTEPIGTTLCRNHIVLI
jgi:hypothetical protein